MGQKLKVSSWIATGILVGVLAVVSLQTVAEDTAPPPLPLEQLQELSRAFDVVQRTYVEPVDTKKLITDAIAGMVSGLDPHSQYLDAKSLDVFQESVSGNFSGVGMRIEESNGLVRVVSPIDNSPAQRAGIQSGDYITRVNGVDTRGLSVAEVVNLIRGETGTSVRVVFFRQEENRNIPLTLVRSNIQIPSVQAKLIEPGYVWVRVNQFQERTIAEFAKAMREMYEADPKIQGIVLDLRNDPGGLLDAAVGLSAAFLPQGTTIVSTQGQAPGTNTVLRASKENYLRCAPPCLEPPDPLQDLPMVLKTVPAVVLVNGGSASASEIVAAALQDHQRATVMGAQTFGKGSVQTTLNLSDKSLIKITTAYYYTPNGKSLQSVGVVPDIFVDEVEGGNPFAALRQREADIRNHLENPNGKQGENIEFDLQTELAREEALRKLEEEARKKAEERLIPEYGSDEDFALRQALNKLQGKPVLTSNSLGERESLDSARTEEKP